ncbi:MAG: hypothetical protein ACFB9M_09675 [Myxococcota bacterium]
MKTIVLITSLTLSAVPRADSDDSSEKKPNVENVQAENARATIAHAKRAHELSAAKARLEAQLTQETLRSITPSTPKTVVQVPKLAVAFPTVAPTCEQVVASLPSLQLPLSTSMDEAPTDEPRTHYAYTR